MEEKITLESQNKYYSLVISDISRCKAKLKNILQDLCLIGATYYMINHNLDIDENGELIRPHYHLILHFSKRKRAKHVLGLIADIFNTNTENVQIRGIFNFIASLQYLIHLNDKSKTQYSIDDIWTNDDRDLLRQYIDSKGKTLELTTDILIDLVVYQHKSNIELLNIIGLGNFTRHLRVIQLLRQEYHNTTKEMFKDTDLGT